MLMPEVSASAIVDFKIDNEPNKTGNHDINHQWLEEEKEIETVVSISEETSQESGGSSDGFAIEQDYFIPRIQTPLTQKTQLIPSNWIILPKNPRYIQFCNLKLDC